MPAVERLEARVVGLVQGVGFRWFVTRQASRLGVTGWVANQPDGSVRVVGEGRPDALRELERLLALGPPGARVDSVVVTRHPSTGHFTRFQTRPGSHAGD